MSPIEYFDQESHRIEELLLLVEFQKKLLNRSYNNIYILYLIKIDEIARDFKILKRLIDVQREKDEELFIQWQIEKFYPKLLQIKNKHLKLLDEIGILMDQKDL